MSKDFSVELFNDSRTFAMDALGTDNVYIVSPVVEMADLPGMPNTAVYMLDLDELTTEQRERLTAFLANQFGLPFEEVAMDLDRLGVPIRAVNCRLNVHNQKRFLAELSNLSRN